MNRSRARRRNQRLLEQAIANARARPERAIAWHELGLSHDNNSREAEAIPCYEHALRLGLDHATRARAQAWLASSCYKVGDLDAARRAASQALRSTIEEDLLAFIALKRRIANARR